MNQLTNTFKQLVTIASPIGEEQELADFLVAYFRQRQMDVEKDQIGNVFVKIPGIGESFFISAHMDTVTPGENIVPIVIDGVISSKGNTILGADNKSTIAVILEVIDRLKDTAHRPLEILFTIDEESANTGAKKFDYTKITAKKGMIADIALPIGTVVLGSPAYTRFDITFIGKSGHAAFPEKADTIIPVIGSILSEVTTGKLDEQTILNIGVGTFGDARNIIPGTAMLTGEIRSFDEALLYKHMQSFFDMVQVIAKRFTIKTKIDSEIDNPAYVFKKEDPYIQQLARIFLDQGISPTHVKSWSVSDANIFNTKRLQVINIGDGAKDTHTTHESIRISEMEKLANIFQSVCQMH